MSKDIALLLSMFPDIPHINTHPKPDNFSHPAQLFMLSGEYRPVFLSGYDDTHLFYFQSCRAGSKPELLTEPMETVGITALERKVVDERRYVYDQDRPQVYSVVKATSASHAVTFGYCLGWKGNGIMISPSAKGRAPSWTFEEPVKKGHRGTFAFEFFDI